MIDQIPEMVYRTYAGDNKFSINTWDRSNDYSIETRVSHGTPQAYVNIIKGCDKFGLPPLNPNLKTIAVEPMEQMLLTAAKGGEKIGPQGTSFVNEV